MTEQEIQILYLITSSIVAGAGFVGGVFFREWRQQSRPMVRDKELFNKLIQHLNEDNFMNKTKNRMWSGKFIYESLEPFHTLLDDAERHESKFLDKEMEVLRLKLLDNMDKLHIVFSNEFDIQGATKMGSIYKPREKYQGKEGWEDLNMLLNQVSGLCSDIYAAYDKFYTAGYKKFGERI